MEETTGTINLTQETTSDNNQMYLDEIQNLKANSVSKDEYAKLQEDNKRLLKSLVNGTPVADGQGSPEKVDINALRKDLFMNENLSNLEYAQNALKLRQELIDSGQPDPFLPQGVNINPTSEDREAANRVAEVMQECIDYADGDSQIFTAELMRRTNDTKIIRRR